MRVAFVSLFTPDHGETPARLRTRRFARQLAARGHQVTWLCARWWGGGHDTFEEDGITYRSVVTDPAPGRFAAGVPAALRRTSPEIVHAVNSPPGAATAAEVAGTLLRVPVIVDWWRDREEDSARRYRLAARGADAVTVPARTTKTRVREHGAGADAVRVLPESVDFDLVESAAVDDRFDFVYARRLDRHANVETFLLALAELRDREWQAAVIGDGPERDVIERTAADLRIDDRVTFLGDLPREEAVPILKGAHVAAGTATREAFPTELLWALACGCVGLVEYQAESSAHELVEGRKRGRLVTSPAELADEIVAVADLPKLRVADEFREYDDDAVLETLVDIYRDLRGE
ncbi:glycosyltransferase [Halorubrum gandharaense]